MTPAQPAPLPPIEVAPRDLEPYRKGNTGVDYVFELDSGRPGPTAMVVGLTHGNEFPGMTAVTLLLDRAVQPLRGRLILALANVEAYSRFDPANPALSRFVDRDLNRVWRDDILSEDRTSHEAQRARELAPFVRRADALFDIHTTFHDVVPMLCYTALDKNVALARRLGHPHAHVVSAGGRHQGGLLIEYGRFSDATAPAAAVVIECGQHFARRSGAVGVDAALRFLTDLGLIAPETLAEHRLPTPPGAPVIHEIVEVLIVGSDACRFARPFKGFEVLAKGELIAQDGPQEVRAPFDGCVIIMPKPILTRDREMVTLGRLVA